MDTQEQTPGWARARLLQYRRTIESRDERVREAQKLGLSKSEIFALSGIARTTINRILAKTQGD